MCVRECVGKGGEEGKEMKGNLYQEEQNCHSVVTWPSPCCQLNMIVCHRK